MINFQNVPLKNIFVLAMLAILLFSVSVYSVKVTVIQAPVPETAAPAPVTSPTTSTTTSGKVISIQFPNLVPETTTPECFAQPNDPRLFKVIYDDKKIFEVSNSFDCGKLYSDVVIDPAKGTLAVTHIPIQSMTTNSIYSIEIWGLNDAEYKNFKNLSPDDKEHKRQFQFILKQGELGTNLVDVIVGGATYKAHTATIDLSTAIDNSNTKWYPKKDAVRCKVKFGCWINNGAAANCEASTPAGKCDNAAQIDETWKQFTFKKFYDFIKKDSTRKFYLVVENSIDGSTNWTDSIPIPLSIGEAPATPAVTTACKTIVECKALIDRKFAEVFS